MPEEEKGPDKAPEGDQEQGKKKGLKPWEWWAIGIGGATLVVTFLIYQKSQSGSSDTTASSTGAGATPGVDSYGNSYADPYGGQPYGYGDTSGNLGDTSGLSTMITGLSTQETANQNLLQQILSALQTPPTTVPPVKPPKTKPPEPKPPRGIRPPSPPTTSPPTRVPPTIAIHSHRL